jgi:ribosome-binding factor A
MREVKDPAAGVGLLTITNVRVSPDLSHARILIGVVGPSESRQMAVEGLNRASGFMRRELKNKVNLRRIPALTFELDETADRSAQLDGLFTQLRRARAEGGHEEEQADPYA